MVKVNVKDVGGFIVKNDERYVVKDNTHLNNLVLSSTDLNPGRQTSGHHHKGQEEVYIFTGGNGRMLIGEVSSSYKRFRRNVIVCLCI